MKIKINIAKYILISSFLLLGFINFQVVSNANAQDLLQDAYEAARTYDTVINLGNTKDSVGKEILQSSTDISLNENFGQGCFVNGNYVSNLDEGSCSGAGGDWDVQIFDVGKSDPLVVRITKLLLRIMIVLSITMIMFNAIIYIIEIVGGKERTATDSQKNLILIVVGIIIALSSVGIIYLLSSISYSTLRTSEDTRGQYYDAELE